jgi:DNA-directed RNA polymerase subunit RPC12/RpoP/parvulin-like peptidyl-prolyl isomerase
MELSTKCPKCGREAWVLFEPESGQKLIKCRWCGNIVSAAGLDFIPNPEFLYKYRPHDCYSESWILNEELFFASPALFNDPFDSKVMYTLEGTVEQKKKYLSEMIQAEHPQIRKREKWKIITNAVQNQLLENDYDGHVKRIQDRIDTYGIVSFSRKPDDLLMFSYYAEDHTGYCLKYRRSKENVLNMAREINYEPLYPKFSVFEFSLGKVGVLGDKVLLTKAKCWEHEAEWRISFANHAKRLIKSPHPILEGIILRCKMTPEKRAEIIALNSRREKPAEILQARKKKFDFALEIVALSSVAGMV